MSLVGTMPASSRSEWTCISRVERVGAPVCSSNMSAYSASCSEYL